MGGHRERKGHPCSWKPKQSRSFSSSSAPESCDEPRGRVGRGLHCYWIFSRERLLLTTALGVSEGGRQTRFLICALGGKVEADESRPSRSCSYKGNGESRHPWKMCSGLPSSACPRSSVSRPLPRWEGGHLLQAWMEKLHASPPRLFAMREGWV